MEGDKKLTLPNSVQQSLEDLIKNLNIRNYTLEISAGSEFGDNYLGVITKVKVLTEDSVPKLHLIIKFVDTNDNYRKSLDIDQLYQAEINAYQRVFPEMIKLQEELGIGNRFNPFPKLYKSSTLAPHEFLIMEDKSAEGFVMRNKTNVIDSNHCFLTMKAYGKYHALSYAIKEKKPDVWKWIQNRKEKLFTKERCEKISKLVVTVIDKLKNHMDPAKEKALLDKLYKLTEGISENLSAAAVDDLAVFCHGDSWSNNFLYQYQDKEEPSKATSICILDWQMSKCASPAVDLSYFIFASTDKYIRQNHFDDLLEAYRSSMYSFLHQLGCDASFLTLDSIKEQMRMYSKYGLLMTILVVPLMLAEKEELNQFGEINGIEDNTMYTDIRKNEKIIMERLIDIVRDFDDMGYFGN